MHTCIPHGVPDNPIACLPGITAIVIRILCSTPWGIFDSLLNYMSVLPPPDYVCYCSKLVACAILSLNFVFQWLVITFWILVNGYTVGPRNFAFFCRAVRGTRGSPGSLSLISPTHWDQYCPVVVDIF